MHVDFLKSFSKDLDRLNQKSVQEAIMKIIAITEQVERVSDVPNLKKLKGHKNAYRIRLGDYRIGVFVEGNTVEFARVLHRKEIYTMFP